MHELQIASNLVTAVLEAAKGYKGVEGISEIYISIGRLTFVGEEQLKFCWGAVTEEQPLLKGSQLIFDTEDIIVKCGSCGFEGDMVVEEDPMYHYISPVFACPSCGSDVEIIKGKGITVNNVKLMIEDGGEE